MIQGLVLSAGMPRAGSGWHYNLVHDLILAGGGQDARQIRQKYHLQSLLTEVNCNLATLSVYRLIPVLLPSLAGNTFAIKTHAGPTATAGWLIHHRRLVPVYIYRDPRAALMSAYEIGKRASERGRTNAFSSLTTLEKAADFINMYVHIWEQWMTVEDLLAVRYEDLVNDYASECAKVIAYLSLDHDNDRVHEVILRYQPEKGASQQRGTHFSQGKIERFRREFSPEQLECFTDMFAAYLEAMGYPA